MTETVNKLEFAMIAQKSLFLSCVFPNVVQVRMGILRAYAEGSLYR